MQINVKYINYYCSLSFFLFLPFFGFSQLDIGFQLGTSLYDGDLAPSSFGDRFQTLHATFGLVAHYHINRNVSVFAGANQLRISGDHAFNNNPQNLSFESNILEGSIGVELFPMGFDYDGSGRRINPFVTAGVGYFSFDPEATTIQGNIVKLQPLGTEGQGVIDSIPLYDLSGISVPLGAGVNISINSSLYISLKGQIRLSFTDYLDDVSTVYPNFNLLTADENRGVLAAELSDRSWELAGPNATFDDRMFNAGQLRGNPDADDIYMSFTVGVHLLLGANGGGGGRRSPLGCPDF